MRCNGFGNDTHSRRSARNRNQNANLSSVEQRDVRQHAAAAKREIAVSPAQSIACAKVFAYHAAVNYRESYGMYVCNGILFNHESPRPGENFVTRKVTRAVARIKRGLQDKLYLGNLEARRDWGYAPEYVEAMWQMLQQDNPDDYVIATGESRSVEEFVIAAFDRAEMDWREYIEIDPVYYRPAEVDLLAGDASKAKALLGWEPQVRFSELVRILVDADIKLAAGRTTGERRIGE